VSTVERVPERETSASGGDAGATVGSWLRDMQPAPPGPLAARLTVLLAPYAHEAIARLPDACLAAGEELLEHLLKSGTTSRATALDLLSVDALVTYAFQAAADHPQELEARAAGAMARIAALPHMLAR